MTTSTGRAADSRRSGRVGQWLVGLLIVLAVVASVLMLFTDQISVLGSLAVIAALWAAVIAAILITRYRRQAESAESKSRDLRLVYELQLEREIAARRQYELDVESTIRKEISDEAGVELAELKAQVLALRSSLEMLLGESLPDQRAALPNEKLRELASGLGGLGAQSGRSQPDYGSGTAYPGTYGSTDFTAHDDGALAARDFEQTAPGAEHRRRDSRPFDAPRRFGSDVDPNELTEVLPVVQGDAPISGRIATEVPLDEIRADEVEAVGVDEVIADEVPEDATTYAETPTEDPHAGAAESRAGETPHDDSARGDASAADYVAPDVVAEEVVVDVVEEQPSPRAPYTSGTLDTAESSTPQSAADQGPTTSAPFSGGFYVGPSRAATSEPSEQGATEADAEVATDVEVASEAEVAPDVDVAPETSSGRHETGDDATRTYGGGRRRRDEDDDHDAAHTAGLPVAELLNQLRQSPSGGGGGRRRRED